MPNSPVAEGETIAQKYRIERVIGEGGMGVVVAAWHLGLHQRVAIKFLLADVTGDPSGASERFRREGRAAARIRSEHVCRVLDVGTLDSGVPFMVMEYLEGCDLASELERLGRLPSAIAVEYVMQACEALAEAHVAGIVHRDLKPANLFLAQRADGSRAIKVLDFGVSKSRADAGVSHLTLTRTSALIGSPIYMSPEQLESAKDVDARADIWALGSILYELVSGRTPFSGDSIPQLVNAVLYSEPPPLSGLGVEAPPALDAVIRHALAKDRELRFASVAELTQELAPLAPAHAAISVDRVARVLGPLTRARSAVPGGDLATAAAERPAATPQPVERDSGPIPTSSARGRLAWAFGLALLFGIGLWLTRARDSSESAAPPSAAAMPPAGLGATDDGARSVPAVAAPAVQPARVIEPADAGPAPQVTTTPEAAPAALPSGVELSAPGAARAPPAAAKRPDSKKPARPTPEPASSISDFGGRR